jgi:hypothetical protein
MKTCPFLVEGDTETELLIDRPITRCDTHYEEFVVLGLDYIPLKYRPDRLLEGMIFIFL